MKTRRSLKLREEAIRLTLLACALTAVVTTISIVVVLGTESAPFFAEISVAEFLFGTQWTPLLEPRSFGVLPLVGGTMMIVVGASLVALPIGLGSATYLSEYASERMRRSVKPVLEVLAGIPTVVYGYFALTFVTPMLQTVIPSTEVFNAASGAIVVGIMILPMVTSLCDDAMRAVPMAQRQAAYALGATSMEVSTRIVVPSALSGIVSAFVLAFSRAVGETMAVTLAAGATPNLTIDPLVSVQTMTSYIVQVCLGDTPTGTVEYHTVFAVGALLFVMTLSMNMIAHRVMKKYREAYE